jgi:CheY-like chemotaxis protein/nitrogen-specific signal transduction histidine kinase
MILSRIMGRARPKRKAAKRARKAPPKRKRVRRPGEAALAALAHDIRTPLTGILALAELLATSDLPARERGWAMAIKSAAEHLAQSASLVLDAAKAGATGLSVRREPFSPRRLAEAVAASLSARAGTSGLSAEVSIASDMPDSAIGDPVRLRSALENLIDNAVKFTARGRIRFEAGAKAAPGRRLRLVFAMTDSGIGLSPAEIRKLFKPFAQASEEISQKFGGTGLGLVLVKRIAKAMGGDLAVVSKKGSGSTFTLTVLADAAPALSKTPANAAQNRPPLRSLRILCAEDNPFARVVLSAILTELGHRLDFAGSGEAAVNAVARGDYDLVLMDVTLPGLDGLEATRRIRALPGMASQVQVIGISGKSSEEDRRRALEAGMNGYLAKPISPRPLAEAIAGISL